jgi:sulfopyruvate decarboxylase subunit alpha
MGWAEILVEAYKDSKVDLITYIPDNSLAIPIRIMEKDPFFRLIPVSREEEGIGVSSGAYAAGQRAGIFMQSSGLGNCVNALGSLNVPARIPIPMLINLRGHLAETSTAQFPMGQAAKPVLDALGILHFELTDENRLYEMITGAIKACYASHQPVGMFMTPLLHGGKG